MDENQNNKETQNENFFDNENEIPSENKDESNEKTTENGENQIFHYEYGYLSKKEMQKTQIRGVATTIAIPLLAVHLISEYWSHIYLFIASSFGISRENAANFANNSATRQILQIFLSIMMFILPFVIAIKISKKTVSSVVSLKKPKKEQFFPYFLLGFSFCFIANVAVSLSSYFFESFGVNYKVDFGDNPEGFYGFLLTVIATAVVPALVEEFAMRGAVMGLLLPYGEGFAILVSSLFFGVMHGNFEQMPFALLVGLILGYIRVKTDTLWVCVLVHGANNLVSVIIDYLLENYSSDIISFAYNIVICVFIILFVFAIFLIQKQNFEKFSFSFCEKCDIIKRDKYKWFFTSVFVIVVIALYLLKSFKYFY